MAFKNNNLCISNEYPIDSKYFKEEKFFQTIYIPKCRPDIDSICDIFIQPTVLNVKLVKTNKGLSNEGRQLTGYELLVEVQIDEKLTYIADEPTQSVFAIDYQSLKSIHITLPECVNDKSVYDLFKSSRLTVMPFLEHTSTRKVDARTLNTCTLLFLDVQLY